MPGAGRGRVLIVEDEPSIIGVCKRVLNGEGFEVDVAGNGKAAEDSVAKRQYDLLLVDIRMPVESGIEFYVWLQRGYPHLSSRVIFMTGSVMGGETMTFLEGSGRPYLLKPFRSEELMVKVRESLGGA